MKDKIENRLLTDEDGHEFRRDNDILLDITAEDAFDYGFEQGAKEQDAKTARFERARAIRIIEHYESTRMSPDDWQELKKEILENEEKA